MTKQLLHLFILLTLLSLIFINQVNGYARVIAVTVYAASPLKVGEETTVQVFIRTGNNRVEYVHNVTALLILPENANLTAGTNPYYIGEMGPGPAETWIREWKVAFKKPGIYTLTVNVTCIDTQYMPRWLANSTTIKVYDQPKAQFNYKPEEIYVNQTVTFNATESYAQGPEVEITNYEWNFGDGTNIALNNPITSHKFEKPGKYNVSLKITDSLGQTATAVKNLTVNLFGDLNSDGEVNIQDLSIIARAFETTPGSPNWNYKADINHDKVIDIRDLTLVAREYGRKA